MRKLFLINLILCLTTLTKVFPQVSAQSSFSTYTYHHPSTDKLSWQRLNLLIASNFYRGTKLSRISHDSALLFGSRALGISRLVVAAQGIDNPELMKQSTWFDERNPGKGIFLLSQTKGKKRLDLLNLLGAYYCYQPGSYNLYRDSVEYFLKTAARESQNSNEKKAGRVAHCLLVKMYLAGADTANGNSVFRQLIKECQQAGDKETEARAFYHRGNFTKYNGSNLQEKVDWLQKASEIYHELKDIESEVPALTNMASLLMAQYRFDDAYNTYLKTLELQRSIDYPYTHYTTDHIAMLTLLQDKFGEPLKYTLESIKVAETTKDSLGIAEFYLRLGQLYYMEGGRSEESLKWMFKSLDRIVATNDGNIYSTLFNIVVVINEKRGREQEALDLVLRISEKNTPVTIEDKVFRNLLFATCYTSLKQFDQAARHLVTADSIRKQSPSVTFSDDYLQNAISDLQNDLNFGRGKYKVVKKYLENTLSDSNRLAVLADQVEGYRRLIYIDSALGDISSGVKHYKQYTAILDSNFRASKVRQAEELQVMYQTKEKEDKITILNQQAKLEHASLMQATVVRNLTIAGIIAVLIIAVLLYRQSRLRKKSNKAITHKNELLQHFLTEKEWLVKEIHHRVKNNLQIVMSLLNSQSAYIDNEPALAAIHDSQHRVHAMSLIHQKLYNTENVSSINMSSYIHELASYLSDSFNTGQRIRFEYNIESLELDVSQAVPLGLILNEAITNSIKYAFPDNRNGVIKISLVNTDTNRYLLTIADNGIGMPTHSASRKAGSLGMSLMAGLSEDIEGTFTIENDNGTIVKISFVHDHPVNWPDLPTSSFVTYHSE